MIMGSGFGNGRGGVDVEDLKDAGKKEASMKLVETVDAEFFVSCGKKPPSKSGQMETGLPLPSNGMRVLDCMSEETFSEMVRNRKLTRKQWCA
jgi:hypothetical protein